MKKHSCLKIVLLVFIVLLVESVFCPAVQAALKGGCAKVNITPPVGCWLSGYGSRDKPSDGIVDELYAKGLVLDDGNDTIAIISTDLLWVPLEISHAVRAAVKEKVGIAKQNVLICATHTHFGPKIFAKTKIGPDVPGNTVDESYVQTFVKKMADSVFLAHKNMQEVRIGAVKGEIPEIVYNRRPTDANGSVQMKFSLPPEVLATREIVHSPDGLVRATFTLPAGEPELTFGPIDPEAWVVRVESVDGEIVGSIVNFACHAVSGSAYPDWFYSISADYPGHTMRIVETAEGGICLFTSGTAGNMVPIKRGKEPRVQIGKALAGEVVRRLQLVRTCSDVSLKALTKAVQLPLKEALSPDRIIDADNAKETLTTEIQVLRIGDIYLLGLPGEVLVEVGLEIKRKAGLENLLVISLSNDAVGYVCHGEAYEEGGYESGSGTNLAQGAGEIMVKEALALLSRMK